MDRFSLTFQLKSNDQERKFLQNHEQMVLAAEYIICMIFFGSFYMILFIIELKR